MNASRVALTMLLTAACAAPVAAGQQTKPPAPKSAAEQKTPGAAPTTGAKTPVNARAAALADFTARAEKYVELHRDAATGGARQKEDEDPAVIMKAQEALAGRIRAMRADAKPGDIFTPAVRTEFRRLLAPETKGEDGRDAKQVLEEDAPSPKQVPFKINAKYPEGTPLPSVPSTFLLNLPTLPEPLEYRIVGKHLILLDTGANIIVDYMTNVIR